MTSRFEQQIEKIRSEFNEKFDDFVADYQAEMSDAKDEVELPSVSKAEIHDAKRKLQQKS